MGEPEFQARVLTMLDTISAKVASSNERIARLEVVQAERCSAQGKRLDDLERRQEEHGGDIQDLKEHQSFSKGQQAALTLVGTAVGAAAGALAPHFFGGK